MSIRLLQWTSNSCYIDSVLTCLFLADKNHNIVSDLFKKDFDKDERENIGCHDFKKSIIIRKLIQIQAYNIYASLNNIDNITINNVSQFRHCFKHCDYIENYSDNGMHDAAEFLSYLIELFGLNASKNHKVYGIDISNKTAKLLDKNLNHHSTPIIPHFIKSPIKLSSLLTTIEKNDVEITRDNIKYSGIITELSLVKSKYLIFHIQRAISQNTINISPVILENNISFNNQIFKLVGVVTFKNNHYTSYILIKNSWYFYDDTQPKLLEKFDIENISKMGILFFYF